MINGCVNPLRHRDAGEDGAFSLHNPVDLRRLFQSNSIETTIVCYALAMSGYSLAKKTGSTSTSVPDASDSASTQSGSGWYLVPVRSCVKHHWEKESSDQWSRYSAPPAEGGSELGRVCRSGHH